MKIRIMIAASMIAALAFTAPIAYAAYEGSKSHERSGEWKEKMEGKRQKLYKNLNLTDEQKKALEANKQKSCEQRKALFATMKEKMTAMREELQSPELNMDKINQIQSELKAAKAQMLDARLQGILETRKILTSEQFKQFMTHMEEHKKHGKHHGKADKEVDEEKEDR